MGLGSSRVGVAKSVLVLLGVAVAAVLVPVGVQAAGQLVTIVDDDTADAAQVEGGRLLVGDGGDALTVEGSVGQAGIPFRGKLSVHIPIGKKHAMSAKTLKVPAGKRLIVTRLSGSGYIFKGESLEGLWLRDSTPTYPGVGEAFAYTQHWISPVSYTTSSNGVRRNITYASDTNIPVGAGEDLRFEAMRTGKDLDGEAFVKVEITGYLESMQSGGSAP